jgi:two-component system, chemotaxis family, sensor kinase CheA
MSDVLDRKEFVAGYLVEVEEHLRASDAQLLAIEASLRKNEPHQRRVRELFRALHTLKGLSAMVGVEPVVEIAHEMEAILRTADQSTGQLSFAAVEVLLEGIRAIEARVGQFGAGKAVAGAPVDLLDALSSMRPSSLSASPPRPALIRLEPELLAKLSTAEQAQLTQGATQGRRVVRLQYLPSAARTAEGVTITTVRERVGQLAEIVKVLPVAVVKSEHAPAAIAFLLLVLSDRSLEELAAAAFGSSTAVVDIDTQGGSAGAENAAGAESGATDEAISDAPLRTNSIRVDVERLDDAMEKLSELVVTRFRIGRAVSALRDRGVDVRELTSIMGENARQLRDLRACITRARMVPVRELLERVPLIVRGMNRSTGKQVRLQIEAGTAELDKSVAERVFPAIVHLVRNAVDHAIESAEERRVRGKPEQGLVSVSCFEHSNSELELRVADDGRGLDGAAIAQRAGREAPKNAKELLELITIPGFSTLDRPTSSSGRGMGMEIVQRIAVNSLGGSLTLRTTPGEGSVFTLRIPLSISIVEAFAFACGEQAFVVPVSMVDEIIEVDPCHVVTPPAPGGGTGLRMIERRGRSMPLMSLAGLLAMGDAGHRASDPDRAALSQKALVVRRTDDAFAFIVDRMLGQQEVVVRPLEDPLVKVIGVAGATDLGDGKPTLVLDLISLIGRANRLTRRAEA